MPSSVYLSFGLAQQKSTVFQIMANQISFGNEAAQSTRVLACRDAFPKDLIPEAKRLTQHQGCSKGAGVYPHPRGQGEGAKWTTSRYLGCLPSDQRGGAGGCGSLREACPRQEEGGS